MWQYFNIIIIIIKNGDVEEIRTNSAANRDFQSWPCVRRLCERSVFLFLVKITSESVNHAWQEARDLFSEIPKLAFRSWNVMFRHYV